jgi:hypothetical protein
VAADWRKRIEIVEEIIIAELQSKRFKKKVFFLSFYLISYYQEFTGQARTFVRSVFNKFTWSLHSVAVRNYPLAAESKRTTDNVAVLI